MANTVIQLKRSSATSVPTDGSLAAAEPAYSYLSDKLFIGNPSGTGVIEIGGRYYSNLTIQAYTQANTAKDIATAAFDKANTGDSAVIGAAFDKANSGNIIASAAFDKANSANLLAYNTGIGANAYADSLASSIGTGANSYASSVGVAANSYADSVASSVGTGANSYASAVGVAANSYASSVGTAANSYADSVGSSVGTGANSYASAVGVAANTYAAAVGVAANTYADSVGTSVGSYANSNFVKLVAAGQTITGNLAITGSLTVSGNAFSIDTETLKVSDPLIYLAGNNYSSDIVDIGFVANYVNSTGSNVHTGFFRDATSKEYYLFQGYDQEPVPNHIDITGNNFTLAVLNADLITSNLTLGGVNAITWIASAFDKANAANLLAYNTGIGANSYASAVGVAANTYASSVGVAANAYADIVGAAANTNAANASYLSTGTVPSGRISGAYTGITAVGTITAGTWNADLITVPYGGTGVGTFTANGILYGNTTGALKVTAAGTEGQVLQANADGAPQFAMLDGGIF